VISASAEQFEATIRALTSPINGQYPRPWMSDLIDPLTATVLVVGKNQRNGYQENRLSHQRHLDALFNRCGETCRGLYDEMIGASSRTRRNTDHFRSILTNAGINRILETNVICYSTPMSADLRLSQNAGGSERGTEIFRALLHFIRPRVVIAHGAGTRATLSKILGVPLPSTPDAPSEPKVTVVGDISVIVIPSLAPPEWNKWASWSDRYLDAVAKVADLAL
jgi:hypothetical protein